MAQLDSASPPTPARRWLDRGSAPHILTLVLIAGLGALNMNIFLPALPAMAEYFQADYAVMQLAVSAYLAITGALQLVIGPLSDRYGRRPVMLVSLGLFLLATLGCVLSTDIGVFLFFRMSQAAIATGIVLSRAVVRDMVGPDKAASMIGYVTMGMALVPMVGPMIGGVLDEYLGWQASFAFTGLFGMLVTAIVWLDMGETIPQKSASFGAQFRAYPGLVTSRRFWGYALVAAFTSGSFFAFLGGGPFVSTEVLNMSPSVMGLYFGFIALGYMIGNFISGRFSESVGMNRMMLSGGLLSAAAIILSLALFGVGYGGAPALFGPMLVVGIGNGMVLPSANAGIVSARPNLAGSASGLGGALMIGGGAGMAALTGALLTPQNGAYVLLAMMLISAALSVVAAIYVQRRERQIERETI